MKTYYRLLSFICAILISFSAWPQGTMLLRQPTISNTDIVFVYANDLWIVAKDGGDARRLTSNEGQESNPHFSPDGKDKAIVGSHSNIAN